MDYCGNQAFNAAELKYMDTPKPSKGNEAYTGGGSVCWGKKRKQKVQEVLQKPPPTLKTQASSPENKGIISPPTLMLRFVRDKEIYRKEGRPWKRGYLLFDSPGTADRSSLIAAMANRVEFDIYDLNLTGLTSISELTNVLASIRSRSLIAIKDFDHWAGKLPYLQNELTLSDLSKIIHGLLSSCGDEQIIVLTTNHNHIDGVDAALLRSLNNDLYIHTPSPRPKALSNGGEIVPLDSSEQKPMVDFDATNNRANQSDVLVSNSEEKNTREALRSLSEDEPCLVDLMTRLSLTDFYDLDSNAGCLGSSLFVPCSLVLPIATPSPGSPIATSSTGSRIARPSPGAPPKATSARITKDDLQRLYGRMTKKAAAAKLNVSVSTVKRIWKACNMGPWKNDGRRRVSRPPDQHGEGNTSTTHETPSHNVQTGMEGEPLGQNQEANECLRDFMGPQIALNPGSGLMTVSRPPDQHGEGNTSTAHEMPSHNVQTGIEGVPVGQNQEANELQPDFTEGSIPSNTENRFIIDGRISESSNLAFPTRSDQAAPSQHVEGPSMRSTVYPDDNAFVMFKAFYGEHTILKFLFPPTSGIVDLKKEVSKRLNVEVDRFEVKYMDEYGHLISLLCDDDLKLCLRSSRGNDEIEVLVLDKVGGTPNFCEKCRSSMQTRA